MDNFVELDYWIFTILKFSKSEGQTKGKFPNNELPSDKRVHVFA